MHGQSGGVFAPAYRLLTLGILLSITAVAAEGMAVATIMPGVASDLGGLEAYGWAFSVFMLASLVGAIAAGEAADRGLTLPALAGFAAFAVGLLVSGSAPVWDALLVGRAIQGLGAGALGSVAYVAIARGYPEHLRPRLLALLSSAWILPSLLGPAIAGQIAEHVTWRAVFFGLLPFVALGAWMVMPALGHLPKPESVGERRGGRILVALRLMLGVGLVLFAVGLQLLPAAIALATVGLILAIPALTKLLPVGVFAARNGLPASVALRGLLAFAFFGSETVIPLGLSTERGIPPSVVGFALTAGALAWVAASWIQDRAESAAHGSLRQRSLRVVFGLVLVLVGSAASAVGVVVTSLPIAIVIAGWALAGLGMGLSYPATTLTALGLAPGGTEGNASAALQIAETIGIATGTGAAGALYAMAGHLQHPTTDGLTWAFLISLVAAALALVPGARLAPAETSDPAPTRTPEPAASV